MNNKVTITVEPADPEMTRRSRLFRRNGIWMSEHGSALYDQYPGQYVAVSEGEVFIADERQEAERLAQEKHPDDEPFVSYISPRKSHYVTVPGKPPTFIPQRVALPFTDKILNPVIESD